ncbi:MAG: hypothetical protein IPG04_01705 [Polyangiaceae bacterium]|nr:hypothetical protein [Polyangiaceae bacterium]
MSASPSVVFVEPSFFSSAFAFATPVRTGLSRADADAAALVGGAEGAAALADAAAALAEADPDAVALAG